MRWHLKEDLHNHKRLVKGRYRAGFGMLSKCKGPGVALYLHWATQWWFTIFIKPKAGHQRFQNKILCLSSRSSQCFSVVWCGVASDGDSSRNTAFSVGMVWKEGCYFSWQRMEPRLNSPVSPADSNFPLCLFTGQMTNWWHFSPDTEIWISWSHTAGTMQGSISPPS